VRTGKLIRSLRPAEKEDPGSGDEESRMAVAISPEGDRLFVAYMGRLRVWDLRTGREDDPFEQVEQDPEQEGSKRPGLSVSPDGRYLARVEHRLFLYEVASGRIVHTLPGFCTAVAFHPSRPWLAVANREHFDIPLYDVRSLFLSLPTRQDRLALADLWMDLADTDAGRAHRAVWRLAGTPGLETFIAGQLKPVGRLDPGWLRRHLADLGSDDFATRQKAERSLVPVVSAAAADLRQARARSRDLERRLRLDRLLALLDPRSPERLRQHRAILTLEARGTARARRLIESLSGGMPGAGLTKEAKAALRRLSKQPGSPPESER
jgi:hypothetical protein